MYRREFIKFLVPALLLILLVAFFPLAYGAVLSLFRKMPVFGINKFTGLDNLLFLLKDLRFRQSLWNTVLFTGISVLLELALGLAVALLMRQKVPGNALLKSVILVPWALPTVVSARMWEWIFNGDFGVLNYLLMLAGITDQALNWLGDRHLAMLSIVIADVWKTTPFAALLIYAGLMTIPGELYEAARIDGAGAMRRFLNVTLPLISPIILIVAIFRTMDALRIFDLVYVLTAGGPANITETLSVYAYKLLFQTLQFGYGSAVSLATFLIIAVFSTGYIILLQNRFRFLR